MTRQFEQLYGVNPNASVEQNVANNPQPGPFDFYGAVGEKIKNPNLSA
jgi:hypothetical protein